MSIIRAEKVRGSPAVAGGSLDNRTSDVEGVRDQGLRACSVCAEASIGDGGLGVCVCTLDGGEVGW